MHATYDLQTVAETKSIFKNFISPKYITMLLTQKSEHIFTLTLWRPVAFGDLQEKNTETHVVFCENISGPVSSKDVASFVACTRKTFFVWGLQIFCE